MRLNSPRPATPTRSAGRYLLSCAALLVVLGGCASTPARPAQLPALRLDPALLEPGAWSQRLRFEHGSQVRTFDALLEIEAGELRLVALAAQREAFRLRWDGQQLQASKAQWMPAEFRADWVLDDLHLSLWPLDALRAALPPAWSLHATAAGRILSHRGEEVVRVVTHDGQRRIEHPLQGYSLRIDSHALHGRVLP